jgi:two-component system, OmpR family, sensor histidine kinase BaeS
LAHALGEVSALLTTGRSVSGAIGERSVEAGIRRLALMVADLHDVSAPIDTEARERASVSAVVRVAHEAIRDSGLGGRCELRLNDGAREVAGDRRALTMAFTHVIRIALAGTANGPAQVRVRVFDDGDHVRIEVADDGEPPPHGVASTLFDPFGPPRGRGAVVGAGVSGVVAARVVAAHGGTISADETRPRGLTMTIRLPVAE